MFKNTKKKRLKLTKQNKYIHPNDLRIEKLPIDDKGGESYFVDGKRVTYRVTQLSNFFFPFEKEITAEMIIDRVKSSTSKYYTVVKNTLINKSEKIKRILQMWTDTAQAGTNVHMMPELFILNGFNRLSNPSFNVVYPKIKKLIKKSSTPFNPSPYKTSLKQYLSFRDTRKNEGYTSFNPEWTIWLKIKTKSGKVVSVGGTIDDPEYAFKFGKFFITIVDWKHIEKIKKGGKIDKFPSFLNEDLKGKKVYLKELQYSLQLHIYKYILETNYKNSKGFNFDTVLLKVICLHENNKNYLEYIPIDLSKSVKKMFKLIKDDEFFNCVNEYKELWKQVNPMKWYKDLKRKRSGYTSNTKGKPLKKKMKLFNNEPLFTF